MNKISTWTDTKSKRKVRRCSVCAEIKDLKRCFYKVNAVAYSYRCKQCHKDVAAERKRKVMARPGAKEKRNATQRAWRKGHGKDKAKAAAKRYRERVSSDPVRTARRRETNRMNYHLRKEREGKLTHLRKSTASKTSDAYATLRLPSAPLVAFIDRLVETKMLSVNATCKNLGISTHLLYDWRVHEVDVSFDVVDKIITRSEIDWHDLYPPGQYPSLYALAA